MADGVNHRNNASKPSSNYSLKVSTENLRHDPSRSSDLSKDLSSDLAPRGGMVVSSPSSGALDVGNSPRRTSGLKAADHYEPHRDTVVLLNDGLAAVVVGSRKSSSANNVDAAGNLVIDNADAVRAAASEAGLSESFRAATEDPPPYDDVEGEGGEKKKKKKKGPSCVERLESFEIFVHQLLERNQKYLKWAAYGVAVVAYIVYLGFAAARSIEGSRAIIGFSIFIVVVLALRLFSRYCGARICASCCCVQLRAVNRSKACNVLKLCFYLVLFVAIIVFIAVDIHGDVQRLTSLFGMFLLLLLGFITSKNPSKVKWRPVFWGLGLQFLLGVLILRWKPGLVFFKFLGDHVSSFLECADDGSKFVFGEKYMDHEMAFKVFPIVIYFSAVISIFYFWGLMQFVVCKIAWLMQFTMGTTAIESLNAACNIFIGMAESCVILRPFLHKLTKSELHAVMTGGFATVAGSYIALLVNVGASAEHLLSAAIMSAPAALAMAKLSYPETEESHTKTEDDVYLENMPARNLVEAASNGAIAAIKVVSSVAANLIAILGLIAFLNGLLDYMGNSVGIAKLSFKMICSVIFWPLAVIMGVEIEDAGNVASLLGTKIFADEFISFRDLVEHVNNDEIKERSAVIATYACCGFGSIAAVGVYIGALISVAPDRRGDISEVALRAVINGNVASFLTACIAGVLFTDGGETLMNFGKGRNMTAAFNTTTAAAFSANDIF